jgi:hypothetical protein
VNVPLIAAILLSRQNLRPSLNDEWVRQLVKAVKRIRDEGWTLNSSIESPNWEIITAASVLEKIPLNLFMPVTGLGGFDQAKLKLIDEFELDKNFVRFLPVMHSEIHATKEQLWKSRDKQIVDSAKVLIPVSVRPGGNMSQLIQVAEQLGKRVVRDFVVKCVKTRQTLSYAVDPTALSSQIKNLRQDYLYHWTRSSNGSWPGETKLEFYKAIFNSSVYPRNAWATLKRIIDSKILMASSKNMPGKIKTVSFSALTPIEIIKLIRWRARYRQMSLEPYGIGIEKKSALDLCIKPVHYFDHDSMPIPETVPKWLTQSTGKVTDWRGESEFRSLGDLDLSSVPNKSLIGITHKKSEAQQLEQNSGIKTLWFCD